MWTRRKISWLVVVVLVLVSGEVYGLYLPGLDVEDPNEPKYVEGELLVRFARKVNGEIPTKVERRGVLAALDSPRRWHMTEQTRLRP